jgi:hypothetical protein
MAGMVLGGATETWLASDPEEKALWLRAFPFASMVQGDFLALDLEEERADNLPVVYLSHDDRSRVLSPSFDEFLLTWQRLCYLHPDLGLFASFFDPTSGYLSGAKEKVTGLQDLFKQSSE